MLIIAAKLDFQTGTLVELRQRNDNQMPNCVFDIIVAGKNSR
jgi:hypothetical protein